MVIDADDIDRAQDTVAIRDQAEARAGTRVLAQPRAARWVGGQSGGGEALCRLVGALPALRHLVVEGFEWDDGNPGVDDEPTSRAELYATCGVTTLPTLISLRIACHNR